MNCKCILCQTLLLFSYFITAQENSISGTITDDTGNPVLGANVLLLNTTKGANSDGDGKYSIENIREGIYYIQISYVGFQTITKDINVQGAAIADFVLNQRSAQLQEVVVTANRKLQNIQKTPAAVSYVNSKKIEQLQVQELGELNTIAPNLRIFDDGGTGSFSVISTRGISTIDFNPAVGFYVDDVPYFTTFSFPLELSDVDNIEVLRGPQGTLYGRNALGGVIKVSTKNPTNEVTGYARVGFGNLNSIDLSAGFSAPLVEDKLFFRASSTISKRDGFVRNTFLNKDLQNREAVDANFKLKYLASDKLSLGLLYNVQRRESDAYAFILPANFDPGFTFQDVIDNNPFEVAYNEDVFRISTTQSVALNAKYDFGSFDLTSVTAYQTTVQERVDEFDFSTFDIQSIAGAFDLSNITQEFRLVSKGDKKFDWTAGVFGYRNSVFNEGRFRFGADLAFTNEIFQGVVPFIRPEETDLRQKGLAIYGQGEYEITDKLSLTLGLRYDLEEASADVFRTASAINPEVGFDIGADFDALSPKAVLGYEISDAVFVYGSYARGFRPGGINTFVADEENAIFQPETTDNIELGLKSSWFDNRIKANLTGFFIDYKNQQQFTVIDFDTFITGTDNIGESRSYGIELETEFLISKGLTLGLNGGYLNTEVIDYTATVPDPVQGLVEIDYSGQQLILAPELNFSSNLQYVQPINSKINFELGADYTYQSEIFFDLENENFQEVFGILNGRVGLTSKKLDFFLWGKNITDLTYFSYGYGISGFATAAYGLPQTYGATLTAKF
ncbi:MAG: TonB-dependent receptor [Bacteroidota bacterium]